MRTVSIIPQARHAQTAYGSGMSDPFAVGATLAFERATERVCAALAEAGVRVLVLKGAAQARVLHGEPSRVPLDIDLLVSPTDLDASEQVLAAAGYRRMTESTVGIEPDHAHIWVKDREPTVDLHWSFSGADPERFWPTLSRSTDRDPSGIEVPNADGVALIVALHAAQHGALDSVAMRDLERALDVLDSAAWVRAAALADDAGASEGFAVGLGLLPAGERMLGAIGREPASISAQAALRRLTPPHTSEGFSRLDEHHTLAARFRFLATKLFPSPAFMQDKYAVAQHGRLGLAVAYLYRPVWLAFWAPQGYLAWRRAKRAAAESRRKPPSAGE